MTNIELNESDLQTELFINREPKTLEEHVAMFTDAPIRVTHLPTGISAIGQGQGNQIKNKDKAIELLKKQLAKDGNSQQ